MLRRHTLVATFLTIIWVVLSVTMIVTNKYILSITDFKFPIMLAITHMLCNLMVCKCFLLRSTTSHSAPAFRIIAPIGSLFGIMLWGNNVAYIHLSVPLIQMMKALGPICILFISLTYGIRIIRMYDIVCVIIVVAGLVLSAFGEIHLDIFGFIIQSLSILADSLRCVMLQISMQDQKCPTSPIVTLYYCAPYAVCTLAVPFILYEFNRLIDSAPLFSQVKWPLLISCFLSVALNVSIFQLIMQTSALSTSVSGILKEVVCITSSVHIFGGLITPKQIAGYGLSLTGMIAYKLS